MFSVLFRLADCASTDVLAFSPGAVVTDFPSRTLAVDKAAKAKASVLRLYRFGLNPLL